MLLNTIFIWQVLNLHPDYYVNIANIAQEAVVIVKLMHFKK